MNETRIINKIQKLVKDVEDPLYIVEKAVRPLMRKRLDALISRCSKCPNRCSIKSITYGDDQAPVMIICEGISNNNAEPDEQIVFPFNDDNERELIKNALEYCEIDKTQLFWINAVNCNFYGRPPNNTEIKNCKGIIKRAIEIMKPVLIILFGAIPLNMFGNGSIMKNHGKWIEINGIKTMPIYSPSFILSMKNNDNPLSEEYQNDFLFDLITAFQYVTNEYPEIKIASKEKLNNIKNIL